MKKNLTQFGCLAAIAVLMAGCQSTGPVGADSPPEPTSQSQPFKRPAQDGAPWWDKDVSKIPDAVPRPHYGPYKAAPYAVLGKRYYPMQTAHTYEEIGLASWYGTKFHGQNTANGEKYDLYAMTAAHKTLPLPSYVRVTNLENGRAVIVRVNDRGPFYADRIIDLSFAAAKKLGFAQKGIAKVKVEGIDTEAWQVQQRHASGAPLAHAQAPTSEEQESELEEYVPPSDQHAAAVTPLQMQQAQPPRSAGLYLQAGAFANPDAAQLLRDKLNVMTDASVFVNSVVIDEQVLHRVRIGPIATRRDAERLQQRIKEADLATPSLVYNQ